ncbi:hypothetical protein EV421DRAFT_1731120 [Armillaria borealis]|uniref:Uncharacterized protein n=1 Tax=Armillaria borealis TaxID=47425 RepID=A0AA39MZK5_9AGAR|nr:hypothetical protein EV421DRAFT_1731120 [Armillaria borealis]
MAPQTQRAWIIEGRGSGPNDVLVLKTTGLSLRNWSKGMSSGYKFTQVLPNFIAGQPVPTEYDFAGVIEDPNNSDFKKYCLLFKTRQGALQEYACVPAECLISRPSNISPTQASGITIVGLTELQGLVNVGGFEAG